MGAPNLVPDNMDNSLSYSVITYLKKLKNQVSLVKYKKNVQVHWINDLSEGVSKN